MQFRFTSFRQSLFLASLLAASLFELSFAQVNLKLLGQLDPFAGDNRYADVWGEGNYAYLGSYTGFGVMIIDISNPAAPMLAGQYIPATGGRFQDVMVIDGIGYFSSENGGGVHIVDVRDPANATLLSQVTPEKNGYPFVHELFVADGVLYEADSRTNIVKAFDVRNPRDPVFLRNVVTTDPRFIHAIVVINGRLYTSGWGGKTDIYDVRDILTEAPRLLGAVDSGNSSHSSWVSSNGLLLASARETLDGDVRLFDISDPSNPRLLSAITAESLGINAFSAHNPYIIGNLLFVSWYQAGLVIVDITNPRQPRLIATYDTYSGGITGFKGCWGVYPFLGLDRVLLSDLDGGLFVIDAIEAIVGPKAVSAANYKASSIASKSIVSAFGTNLSSATLAASTIPLPTSLAGTTVQVQDSGNRFRFAPLFFISPSQINFQIPAGTVPGPAAIYISTGESSAQIGAMIVASAAPSIFTVDQSGKGAAVVIDAFTFTGAPFNAIRSDGQPNIVAIFGTGLGDDATDVESDVSATVQASIDGQPVKVLYAGRAPGFVGLNQINIEFPAGVSSGDHSLVVIRNAASSNAVTITIKR